MVTKGELAWLKNHEADPQQKQALEDFLTYDDTENILPQASTV